MGYTFLPWDHDQQYLLPPDHEVWAVLEAASLLDFADFFARRRVEGWGWPAYHPAMIILWSNSKLGLGNQATGRR